MNQNENEVGSDWLRKWLSLNLAVEESRVIELDYQDLSFTDGTRVRLREGANRILAQAKAIGPLVKETLIRGPFKRFALGIGSISI